MSLTQIYQKVLKTKTQQGLSFEKVAIRFCIHLKHHKNTTKDGIGISFSSLHTCRLPAAAAEPISP